MAKGPRSRCVALFLEPFQEPATAWPGPVPSTGNAAVASAQNTPGRAHARRCLRLRVSVLSQCKRSKGGPGAGSEEKKSFPLHAAALITSYFVHVRILLQVLCLARHLARPHAGIGGSSVRVAPLAAGGGGIADEEEQRRKPAEAERFAAQREAQATRPPRWAGKRGRDSCRSPKCGHGLG